MVIKQGDVELMIDPGCLSSVGKLISFHSQWWYFFGRVCGIRLSSLLLTFGVENEIVSANASWIDINEYLQYSSWARLLKILIVERH